MSQLVVAAIVFLVGHFGISSTPLRPVLIQRLGEKAYLGLYSVAALAAFVWLVMSWSAAPYQPLWDATTFWRHLPYGGVLMSCILLVGGLTTANPSMAGKPLTEAYDGDWQPKGILSVTRHPVMWAIGIWALVHLGANGDLAAVIFFGSIALHCWRWAALCRSTGARMLKRRVRGGRSARVRQIFPAWRSSADALNRNYPTSRAFRCSAALDSMSC